MAKPHSAAIIEDRWNQSRARRLHDRGWSTKIISYTGYGSEEHVRILARVLWTRRPHDAAAADAEATALEIYHAVRERRGWRAFMTTPAANVAVTITVGERTFRSRTDRSGILDVIVAGHSLPPGWHEARLTSERSRDADAAVLIVSSRETFGLVSDIDDTVIKTMLPRPMIAAWNTFVRHEGTRSAVPGMATLYRELLGDRPDAPIVYVSTGAWNTAPHLTRFLRDNGYPLGPLLLTDWGPTNTGWFRSGQDHKRACLHRLARELPTIRWVLIGDDGQHDPSIYGEFAEQRPDRVRAIAIRVLSAAEQMLSHFTPMANPALGPGPAGLTQVPVCRASDGYGLARLLRAALAESDAGEPAPKV